MNCEQGVNSKSEHVSQNDQSPRTIQSQHPDLTCTISIQTILLLFTDFQSTFETETDLNKEQKRKKLL